MSPGCLPSAGTLPRIRWPSQPRSHEHAAAFAHVAPAEWRSHAILGLRRSSPYSTGEPDSRVALSPEVSRRRFPVDARFALGPCAPDPDRSFWSAFAERIRDQTSPTDFCNYVTTCEQPNPSSSDPRWTETSISFLFVASRPLPCGSGDARRVALRPFVRPHCRFLSLARAFPTVMPLERPTTEDCSCGA